jgi:spermidine synthase
MSTRQHASEEKIAELACAHIRQKARARVLIGGLGFGFTLKAVLSAVAPGAAVVVSEILPAVIDWNRNPQFPLAAGAMADPRVTILRQDVRAVLRENRGTFDSIILDVDNGPAALTTEGNDKLYDDTGLQAARQALRPSGCVAYWSAAPSPAFEKRLARAGFLVDVQPCRSRPNAGSWHTLFLGRLRPHEKRRENLY